MSTLNVSNITDGTDTVETGYVLNGSAKSWCNFDGTGTIATRNSLNVSSLTDISSGAYQVSFTNNFSAADWSGYSSCQQADVVNPGSSYMDVAQLYKTQQADSLYVMTNLSFTNTNKGDAKYVLVGAHGDLA